MVLCCKHSLISCLHNTSSHRQTAENVLLLQVKLYGLIVGKTSSCFVSFRPARPEHVIKHPDFQTDPCGAFVDTARALLLYEPILLSIAELIEDASSLLAGLSWASESITSQRKQMGLSCGRSLLYHSFLHLYHKCVLVSWCQFIQPKLLYSERLCICYENSFWLNLCHDKSGSWSHPTWWSAALGHADDCGNAFVDCLMTCSV